MERFHRIDTSRVGFRTTELMENLSVAEVRKPGISTSIHVDHGKYRARLKAEMKEIDPHAQVPYVTAPQARRGPNDILQGPSERTMLCKVCWHPQWYCRGHTNVHINLRIPQLQSEMISKAQMVFRCICFHHGGLNFHLSSQLQAWIMSKDQNKRLKLLFEHVRRMNRRYCHEDYDVIMHALAEKQAAAKAAALERKQSNPSHPSPSKKQKTKGNKNIVGSSSSSVIAVVDPDVVVDLKESDKEDSDSDEDEEKIRKREERMDEGLAAPDPDDDDDNDEENDEGEGEVEGEGEEEGVDEEKEDAMDIDAEEEDIADVDEAGNADEPVDMDLDDAGEDGGEEGGGGGGGGGEGDYDGGYDDEGRKQRRPAKKKKKPVPKPKGGKRGSKRGLEKKDASIDRYENELKAREQYQIDVKDFKEDTNQFWKPASGYRFSRLSKPLSPCHFKTQGCGFPLPEFSFEGTSGLDMHFAYHLPWEGNVSKKPWPQINNMIIYNVLRNLDAQGMKDLSEGHLPIHELFGMHPYYSPFRGLMVMLQPPLPPTARPAKNEGAKNTAPDDNLTTNLRQITTNSKRMECQLWREDQGLVEIVKAPDRAAPEIRYDYTDLGSPYRHVYWVKRPRPWLECTCKHVSIVHRCICDASGTKVLCQCDDPDVCHCIVASLPEGSVFRKEADIKKFTDVPVSYREIEPLPTLPKSAQLFSAVKRRFERKYAKGSVSFLPKPGKPGRRWEHSQSQIGNEIVSFISGDIKKRSEGRKAGRKGVAPWAAGNAAQIKAGKQERALAHRQIKKQGRLRGSMMSKRCNSTIRDVIMPKIFGGMDTMYFPTSAKNTLSFPHLVNRRNRAYCHDRIRNGEALRIRTSEMSGRMHNMEYLNSGDIKIRDGITIEMILDETCYATMNRQPTLWMPSMQGASMRFVNAYVFMLGIENCPPYNADFDGDEMTAHLARTQLTRAENADIMMAKHAQRSQHGMSATMGMIQNGCIAGYRLSRKDCLFTRRDFVRLCGQFQYADNAIQAADSIARLDRFLTDGLPIPGIAGDIYGNEPEPLWTGCQLISLFLPDKICYTPKGIPGDYQDMEKKPVILSGRMLCGRLTKDELGPGSTTLPQTILNDFGPTISKYWIHANQLIWNYYVERWPISMCRDNYMTDDSSVRTKLVTAISEMMMKPENQTYDMLIPNDCENFIIAAQKRVQELTMTQLMSTLNEKNRKARTDRPWESIAHEGSAVPNHVLSQTDSKTKGTSIHIGQLGVMYGMLKQNRMPSQTAHANYTSHLPEFTTWISTPLSEGISSPIEYLWLLWMARFGMVETNRRVPNSGYILRRLTAFLAGLHREHDGTMRDPYGNIYQFKAGDDDMNPAMCEYVPFIYMTPTEEADTELRQNQAALVMVMTTLNRCIDYKPRSFVLPVDLHRVFQKLILDIPRHQTPHEATLTRAQVRTVTEEWYRRLQHVLKVDIEGNLLMKTLCQDMLSPWHIAVKCKLTMKQLKTYLSRLEVYFARAVYPAGHSMGTMTAQSTTEPATQMGLNMFKHMGNKAPTSAPSAGGKESKQHKQHKNGRRKSSTKGEATEEEDESTTAVPMFHNPAEIMESFSKRAGLVPPPASQDKLNETINATKKDNLSTMNIALRPPFNLTYENAWLCAQWMRSRTWANLIDRTSMYDHIPGNFEKTVAQWPDKWAQRQIRFYPDASISITSFPTFRYEFNRLMFYVLGLSVNLNLLTILQHNCRRGLFVMHSEMDESPSNAARTFEAKRNEPIVVYININLSNQPPLAKRVQMFQENQPKLAPARYKINLESVIERYLNSYLPRCFPQIKAVDVIEISSFIPQPHNHKEPVRVVKEWVIQSQGSALEGLQYARSFVRYIHSTTTFVHDVSKVHGTDAARECQVGALESFVRPVSALDGRPLGIIADTQTAFPQDDPVHWGQGRVTCATRASIAERDPGSVLLNAGFEEPLKQILEGAAHAKSHDTLLSISASTQVGNSLSVGTGSVTVLNSEDVEMAPVVETKQVSSQSRRKKDESSHPNVVMQPAPPPPIVPTDEQLIESEASLPQRERLTEPRDWGFYQFFAVDGPQCLGGTFLGNHERVDEEAREPELIATFESTLVRHPDQMFFPNPASLPPLDVSGRLETRSHPQTSATTSFTGEVVSSRIPDGYVLIEEFQAAVPWHPLGICTVGFITHLDF